MKTKVYTKSIFGKIFKGTILWGGQEEIPFAHIFGKIFKGTILWGGQEEIPFAHICRDALEQNAVGIAVQETFYFLNNSSKIQEKKLFLFMEGNWRTVSKAEAILLNRSQELAYIESSLLEMPNQEFFYSEIWKALIPKDDNVFIFECSWI